MAGSSFIIEGGHRIEGTLKPSGNKNAALPLLAACLLTDQEVVLGNVPDILDVRVMLELLERLGATVRSLGDSKWSIRADPLSAEAAPPTYS